MTRQQVADWLLARAAAHRNRSNEYSARCVLYRWGGATETDRADYKQASALADQHVDYAIALTEAAEAILAREAPDCLPPIAPPLLGSYAAIVARQEADRA